MKKTRVSSAQRNEALAQTLEAFKRKTTLKTVASKAINNKKSCKTNQLPEPQAVNAVNRTKIENLPWLEDRARENVKQWGVRAKIDVEKIQALAARLKITSKKNNPQSQRSIRYIATNGTTGTSN